MQEREDCKINTTHEFNPQDEKFYCPNLSKSDLTGHGLLKKY
jgi:hypothetical protein